MKVEGDFDTSSGASRNFDMRIDTALADQAELRQASQKRSLNLRSFPEKRECLGVVEPIRQCVYVLQMIVPDFDLMPAQLFEALQGFELVMIIIEDRDLLFVPVPSKVRDFKPIQCFKSTVLTDECKLCIATVCFQRQHRCIN